MPGARMKGLVGEKRHQSGCPMVEMKDRRGEQASCGMPVGPRETEGFYGKDIRRRDERCKAGEKLSPYGGSTLLEVEELIKCTLHVTHHFLVVGYQQVLPTDGLGSVCGLIPRLMCV